VVAEREEEAETAANGRVEEEGRDGSISLIDENGEGGVGCVDRALLALRSMQEDLKVVVGENRTKDSKR